MAESSATQTYGFQAEVKQLLHLMVHSLYSNREIFLRELISNASDANDKLRFEALSSPELLADAGSLTIDLVVDPEAKTLSIADTGIGMSRDDLIEQLGTIAHSGTSRFLQKMTGDQKKDSQLIGQFGVGFYSAFIVADEVTVATRRAGLAAGDAVEWTSRGEGEYSVREIEKDSVGTRVVLKLKDDASEFRPKHWSAIPDRGRGGLRRRRSHRFCSRFVATRSQPSRSRRFRHRRVASRQIAATGAIRD